MYVIGTDQCSLPNSETPMSQERIDAQNAFIASVGSAFDAGDAALNSLIQTMGGNPAGATRTGDAGVPTTGTLNTDLPGIPVVSNDSGAPSALLPNVNDPSFWTWAPSPPQIVPGGGAGYRSNDRSIGRRRYSNGPPSDCPTVVPLVTAIPVPVSPPPQPVAQSTPAAAPPAATPPPAPGPLPDCRTGNICLDLRNGCVMASQVSPEQLQICSQAGYAGNLNKFPQIAMRGGVNDGEYFGTPDPTPPPFNPGMSGFGDSPAQTANAALFAGIFEGAVSAIATTVALAILLKGHRF